MTLHRCDCPVCLILPLAKWKYMMRLNIIQRPSKNTSKANSKYSVGDFIHSRTVWHPRRYQPNLLLLLFLIMSLFSCLVLWWSVHTQRPTVVRGLFMRPRDSEGKHKELPTQRRGFLSSALTPEGCVWAAPRLGGPADSCPGSSPPLDLTFH